MLRRADWGVFVAVALSLVAAASFLTRPALPRGTDAELHVFRAAELGYAVRTGALYPRWAPNLFLGYGYPIFNYYAPLTYFLANTFAVLPGVGIVGGVKAVFVLGLIVSAVGAYALGRQLSGRAGGVIAAASFTFAPYVVLIDPHARGDLAEHFAVCLLPLSFYALNRVMNGRRPRFAVPLCALAFGAIVFAHNLMGLIASVLAAGYWLWTVLGGSGWSRAWAGIAAFAIGAACSAFFWLPALLEWNAVELVVTGPGHFDFRNHFISLRELLGPSPVLDLGAAAPDYRFNLGVPQWVLGILGIGALRQRRIRREIGYFAVVGIGLALLLTPVSLPAWEAVRPMAYLQFPWRLLGPANLAIASLAAGGVGLIPRSRWRAPALGIVLLIVLLGALPALYPPMWHSDFGPTSPQDIIAWEAATGALGTTSTRDFVPKGAALVPMHPAESLVSSYAAPGPVDKVNRATIPDGSEVRVVQHGSRLDRFEVAGDVPFVLRLYTFYFPGWRAYIDGMATGIEVAHPEGFITVPVPAGQHDVLVRFEDTPARQAGWAVTVLGVVGLTLSIALPWSAFGASCASMDPNASPVGRAPPSDRVAGLWFTGAVALFLVLKMGVLDPRDDWMRYTSPPGLALPAEHNVSATFGDEIELIGYDMQSDRTRAGNGLEVTLYWRALRAPSTDYQSFVHLAQPLNVIWGQEDHLNPGDLPTTRWPLDRYVRDEYEFQVLPGTPPGHYAINVGLYSMSGGYRLARTDTDAERADSRVLANVEVLRPRRQPSLDDLGMSDWITHEYGAHGVMLAGYLQERRKVDLDEAWNLTLFWVATEDAPGVARRDLVLLDDDEEVARLSGVPGGYAPANWLAGDIVRDPIAAPAARVASVPPERYRLAVVLEGANGVQSEPLVIGTLRVKDRLSVP